MMEREIDSSCCTAVLQYFCVEDEYAVIASERQSPVRQVTSRVDAEGGVCELLPGAEYPYSLVGRMVTAQAFVSPNPQGVAYQRDAFRIVAGQALLCRDECLDG